MVPENEGIESSSSPLLTAEVWNMYFFMPLLPPRPFSNLNKSRIYIVLVVLLLERCHMVVIC